MLRAAIVAMLGLALGTATLASAQDTPSSVDSFRLPPGAASPTPSPSPSPTTAPSPTPTPTPTASPTPSPSPTPTATASPGPTPSPRPTASPRAVPTAAGPTEPAIAPSPVPLAISPAEPIPTPGFTTPLATPPAEVPAAAAPAESDGVAWWVWLGLAVVALGAAAWFLRGRFGRAGLAQEAEDWAEPSPLSPTVSPPATLTPVAPPVRAPGPVPAPPPPAPTPAPPVPAAAAAPPSAAIAPRSDGFLDVSLSARRLSATLLNTALSYELVVTNHGETPVGPVTVTCDMIGAHASLPARLQLENPGQDEPAHRIPHLGPGESAKMSGELRLPLNAITPIRQGAAALFVPLARFRLLVWREGRPPISAHRTFVIGETPPTPDAGLKPFRLDLGPRMYSSISQREVSLPA